MIAGIVAGAPVAGGGSTDPYIAFRVSIANLNVDLSDPLRTWTAQGGAAVTGGALVLDGSGDYLSTPQSTDFDFGAGEFCVEAMVEIAAYPGSDYAVWAKWGSAGISWLFLITSTGRLGLYYYSLGGYITPVGTIQVPLNTPTHVAGYRVTSGVGNGSYVAVAGVTELIRIPLNSIDTSVSPATIGAQMGGASPFAGKIWGCRATKGSSGGYGASNFTPPTLPLPTS